LPHLGFCGYAAGVSGDGEAAQLGPNINQHRARTGELPIDPSFCALTHWYKGLCEGLRRQIPRLGLQPLAGDTTAPLAILRPRRRGTSLTMQRFYLIMPIQVGWNFRKGQGVSTSRTTTIINDGLGILKRDIAARLPN
jgi:hypothetical protein